MAAEISWTSDLKANSFKEALLALFLMGATKQQRRARVVVGVVLGCIVALLAVVALTNIITLTSTRGNITTAKDAESFKGDAIVVLGASVYAGTPSGILQDRLDDGIALYKEGAAPRLLMSGDNSTASYNEVKVMKRYAESKGVPSKDIFCDHAGVSTYDSMYRAKYIYGANRIVIATQTYHLYRALYVAKGLGMEAIGVPSDYHHYANQIQYDLREIPARTKDFFKTLFKLPAAYPGSPISLDQSGDVTD